MLERVTTRTDEGEGFGILASQRWNWRYCIR